MQALLNDHIFKCQEGDQVLGGIEGKEGVVMVMAMVDFKSNAEGREDKEGLCGWVRGRWDVEKREEEEEEGQDPPWWTCMK